MSLYNEVREIDDFFWFDVLQYSDAIKNSSLAPEMVGDRSPHPSMKRFVIKVGFEADRSCDFDQESTYLFAIAEMACEVAAEIERLGEKEFQGTPWDEIFFSPGKAEITFYADGDPFDAGDLRDSGKHAVFFEGTFALGTEETGAFKKFTDVHPYEWLEL